MGELRLHEVLSSTAIFLVALCAYVIASLAILGAGEVLAEAAPADVAAAAASIPTNLWIDSFRHAVVGVAIGAGVGGVTGAVEGCIFSVAIDLDHVPLLLGAPVPGRLAHSLSFLLLAVTAERKVVGRRAAAVLALSLVAHLSLDLWAVPLMAPASWRLLRPSPLCAAASAVATAVASPLLGERLSSTRAGEQSGTLG